MPCHVTPNLFLPKVKRTLLCLFIQLCAVSLLYAQPANDNCTNAEVITISNNGFGTGVFTSSNINIDQATVQPGEAFAPAIMGNGQSKKSIWFKFSIGTSRQIRVTLQQPTPAIQAGDVGFAVYKTGGCLPATSQLSTQLTPIGIFGNTFHPCTEPGDYLVQVSSKTNTAGQVSIQINSDHTGAVYDRPATASSFGTLTSGGSRSVDFRIECQGLDEATEICTSPQQFTKSTWHTFTTPAYLDWLSVLLASPIGSFTGGQQPTIGFRLYKGDVRTTAIGALVPVRACDSLKPNGYQVDYRTFKCGEVDPASTYSIQLFYKQTFNDTVRLAVAVGGEGATVAPQPIASAMGGNLLGNISPGGPSRMFTDYLACNSRHSIHPCGDALPANGINYQAYGNTYINYNLSTFYSFTLTAASNLSFYVNTSGICNTPNLLMRLYRQGVDNNCATLSNSNLITSAFNNTNLIVNCLPPGSYTIQVLGQEAPISNNYNLAYNSLTNNGQLCMLTHLGQKLTVSLGVSAANAFHQFALNTPTAYEKVNNMAPLQNGVTYQGATDVLGCAGTVLPDTVCPSVYNSTFAINKAAYRQFTVADSGTVVLKDKAQSLYYKLFRGDAAALAAQQNTYSYPSRITGLTPVSECLRYWDPIYASEEACRPDRVCVLPGTYTYTSMTSSDLINIQDKPTIKFETHNSKHANPVNAQDMGSLLDSAASALTSDKDYFSCSDNAVTIDGFVPCAIVSYDNRPGTKAIYRQFYLKTASIVSITSIFDCFYYNNSGYLPVNKTVFAGKASDGLSGLRVLPAPWRCFSNTPAGGCTVLSAGWYTVVSYGSGPSYQNPLKDLRRYSYANMVTGSDQFKITITPACPGQQFNRPYKASVDVATNQPYVVNWAPRNAVAPSVQLASERFNCLVDTPFVTGITPCNTTYTRASYYVFRVVNTTSIQVRYPTFTQGAPYSIYALDVRTDSVQMRTAIPVYSCAGNYYGPACKLAPGVYTLVLFGNDALNCATVSPILFKPCNDPYYNRPYRAAVDANTGQPFLIDYAPGTGHTPAYPRTDVTTTLPTDYFNCQTDTPFSSHPIVACNSTLNRVAYYVFRTVRETYVQINTKGFWGAVYPLDVRTDSARMLTVPPVQPCLQSTGFIQLCRLPAGTYTLAVFGDNNSVSNTYCTEITPSIYVDQPGYSRFDRAAKAYDFDVVPGDAAWHNGKQGDVNPLDAARAPSNDFFYCTTGSSPTDPTDAACAGVYNPRIYGDSVLYLFDRNNYPQPPRRNLWYTFVVNQGGTVKVKLNNVTPGRQNLMPGYTVYKSNVNSTLPFSTVVSTGQVDSTYAQGLTGIIQTSPCSISVSEVSFTRDPCTSVPERYYVLVDVPNGTYSYVPGGVQPNLQIELQVQVTPSSATATQFDHYSQAANMGAVGAGTFTGPGDNLTCATRDATDPLYDPSSLYTCTKNVWYKFTAITSGNILYRMVANSTSPGGANGSSYYDIQLFRQVKPGDSTRTGLLYQGGISVTDGGFNWTQTCVAPGTYYILLPGCNRTTETVNPVIKIVEQLGDFCSKPVVASLGGAGSSTTSVKVDCHTIGTDYGEFNPQLSCPANTPTNTYKSSWFRVDIGGTDTLDVTAFLNENTSATSAQIKYRMMTGNCGAMQEQSCVLDALTQNTYKCLTPGSYFFQVFSPANATGTIDLKLNAVKHVDTCAPVNNCLATASFLPQFDCNTSDSVRFVNYSTYGSAIQYSWTFGYNGQTGTEVSPSFFYPALPAAATYNVKLVARNTGCNKSDTVTVPITIPGRPYVNLGSDTSICNGSTIVLNATSHPGSTYEWTIGTGFFATTATTPTITTNVSSNNYYPYSVKVTYGNCTRRDTILVFRSLVVGRKQNRTICNSESIQLFSNRGNSSNETYLWSTGATTSSITVNTAGTYYCDVRVLGCAARDTFIVQTAGEVSLGNDTAVCIRPGRPFVLNATTAGAISYQWQNGTTAATFSATAIGQYWVKINFGNCTLQDTINLTNLQPAVRSLTASLCAGKNYILPSGQTVNTAGIYIDTARAIGGCDSVITTTTLVLKTVSLQNTSATICQGQTYTLPWGTAATAAGTYRDTLRSPADGCDSIVRTVALAVVSAVRQSNSAAICAGQVYTLPSGVAVSNAGAYSDTVRYISGCDSLITTLNLTVKTVQAIASSHSICPGQLFTLPSGRVVNVAGTFYDTLRYASGCDSIRYTINLVVGVPTPVALQVERCSGIAYSLPSGRVVYAAGIYYDTLRHLVGGCDSIHYTITRANRQAVLVARSVSICAGQSYTLPSGTVVNTTGIYPDSLRYAEGCDSLIATYTVTTKTVANRSVVAALCAGQSYTLPSGNVVSTAGLYNDTLRYLAGCDSIITRVNLQVQQVSLAALSPTICQGNWFTMPSGKRINAAGIYKDTLRSIGGCDSVLTTVTLTVTPKPVMGINLPVASVCIGDSLLLKAFGGTTYKWIQGSGILSPNTGTTWIYPPVAGIYRVVISEPVCNTTDTFQSTVRIEQLPKIAITKSNDVSCVQGAAQLIARGGASYIWWPATGLNYTNISNPIALPATNTVYHVRAVSSQNCVAEDSVAIQVIKGDVNAGFLVPSAFTPNTDGSNDCFGVRHWGAVTNLRLSVYDRKGMLVFSTTDPAKCWDGRYKGEPLATAAYVYFITANTICGPVERKGTILLIR